MEGKILLTISSTMESFYIFTKIKYNLIQNRHILIIRIGIVLILTKMSSLIKMIHFVTVCK